MLSDLSNSNRKNILSYKPGMIFSGQEIIDWIRYNIQNKTSHYKVANSLSRYLHTIEDNRMYTLVRGHDRSSASYGKYTIQRVGVDEQ